MNEFRNSLLTANESIVTKNAQAAKNHCALQISFDVSSKLASSTITDVGIKILDTNKSANAMLTMNALPVEIFDQIMNFGHLEKKKCPWKKCLEHKMDANGPMVTIECGNARSILNPKDVFWLRPNLRIIVNSEVFSPNC